MNLRHVRTLADLATKPDASARTQLIATRMICRLYADELDAITTARRALRREASKAKRFLPFTAAAVAALEQHATNYAKERRESLRAALLGFGSVLLLDTDNLATSLGFDSLCDLLSINPVHREQARRDGGETLRGLAFVACAEDSATQQGANLGTGGPLFRACRIAASEFWRTCPPHLRPDPFAPGEVFGPKLPPVLRVVGLHH